MMGKTHQAFSGVFWLGTTLAVNQVAQRAGYDAPFHPAVVVAGVFIAPVFSSGRWLSPDMDHRWAPGPPRGNYNWRYHRGFTHRLWFAFMLTGLFGILPFSFLLGAGFPTGFAIAVFVPINGWWSHLAGDMIYGRILILGTAYGLGWTTGGLSESGGSLIRDPASKVCAVLAAALVGLHLYLLV